MQGMLEEIWDEELTRIERKNEYSSALLVPACGIVLSAEQAIPLSSIMQQ